MDNINVITAFANGHPLTITMVTTHMDYGRIRYTVECREQRPPPDHGLTMATIKIDESIVAGLSRVGREVATDFIPRDDHEVIQERLVSLKSRLNKRRAS